MLTLLLLATIRPTHGQTTPTPPAHKPPATARAVQPAGMTNQDVIDLLKAGFSDDFVVAKITSTKSKAFDVSTKGLVQLKTAGVSERIIDVMLGLPDKPAIEARPVAASTTAPGVAPSSSKAAEPARAESARAPAGSVAAIHDPGIYVSMDGKFVAVESHSATEVGVSGGSMWANALSMGFKSVKMKASMPGTKAVLRLPAQPDFYFSGTAFKVGDYVLVQLRVNKDNRSIQIGHVGGASAGLINGIDKNDLVPVIMTKLDNGISRVTIEPPPLDQGEYAFINVADDKSKEFWDFGVDEVTPPKAAAR